MLGLPRGIDSCHYSRHEAAIDTAWRERFPDQALRVAVPSFARFVAPVDSIDESSIRFYNSGEGEDQTWVAEITDGNSVQIKSEIVLGWFKRAVLDKIGAQT